MYSLALIGKGSKRFSEYPLNLRRSYLQEIGYLKEDTRVYKGLTKLLWRPREQVRDNVFHGSYRPDRGRLRHFPQIRWRSPCFPLPNVSIAHAPTGRRAWQLLQNEPVAAIITDLHMPHMDGFELIERVRAAGETHVPIIVISGDSDPATPERVRRLGADAYFAKPYLPRRRAGNAGAALA